MSLFHVEFRKFFAQRSKFPIRNIDSQHTNANKLRHGLSALKTRLGDVREGDILVGKITPKGESDPTPEEKLLRAIFGDKAGDVKDASLKAPPGMKGVVIKTSVFTRKERSEEAKKEVAGLKADNEKIIIEARKEKDAILKEAKELKEKMKDFQKKLQK